MSNDDVIEERLGPDGLWDRRVVTLGYGARVVQERIGVNVHERLELDASVDPCGFIDGGFSRKDWNR